MKRIGRWFVLNKNRFYFVKIGNVFDVFYNGRVYRIGKDRKFIEFDEEKREEIRAPITGKIVSIKVDKGQKVKRGDILAVVSAMKMEMILSSPEDALVNAIFKKEGQLVNKGDLIIKLEFLENS